VPGEDKHPGARPIGLMTARDNRADDLKRIRGIGPQNEGRLHALGIWHFDQIASWSPENVRWVSSYLAFPGRIDRERWIEQAAMLAVGGVAQVATSQVDGSLGQPGVIDPTQPRPRRPRR
jgi:predicted flap endonuclease-1-like 5' DNA nuclease